MHAFRMDQPPEEYNQLSQKMVSYADGLPLTLEVLGSSLCNKEKEEWDSAIQKLKEVPPKEVLNKLRISFDGLDDKEQSIFLDTACFLIGMDKELAHYRWEGCGFHSKVGLRALIRKSLIKIGDDNKLRMHDQLRDMGRRIVYEENLKKPGKRSRLWSHEAMMVVQAHKGTQEVEGILLDFMCKGSETGDRILIEDLAMMPNLRLLQVNGVNLEGKIEKLPSNLRWLCWQGCILKILPSDFCLDQLLVLDLSNNKIQKAWDSELQNKPFKNLKVLNLSSSSYLEKFPIFTRFPLLEKLILKGCKALTDIHESIGKLEKLNLLDLNGCIKLKKLPDSIGDLKSLVELELDGTQIHELPYSIGMLSTMRRLLLRDCKSLARIYNSIGRLKSLLVLDLSSTLITELPADIELLEKLERLCVKCCRYLQSLPKLPSSLIFLDASGCVSLKRLPNLSNLRNLKLIQLAHCSKLVEIQGLEGVESLEDLDVNGCINLRYTPLEVLVQDSINNQPFSSSDIQQRYEIGNDAISNGMILCLVSELVEEERETEDKGNLLSCTLLIKARIRRNRQQITCTSSLVIEGIQMTTQNIKCIYHFEEPNWFGFPLKGKDEIEIVEIQWSGCTPQAKVLYSKLSSKDREHIQQSVSQLSSRMVKDSFNMSYDDDGRLQSLREKVEANAEMIDMSYVDDGKLYPRPRERESENQQQDNKRRC